MNAIQKQILHYRPLLTSCTESISLRLKIPNNQVLFTWKDSKRQTVSLSQSRLFALKGLLVNFFAGPDRFVVLDVFLCVKFLMGIHILLNKMDKEHTI